MRDFETRSEHQAARHLLLDAPGPLEDAEDRGYEPEPFPTTIGDRPSRIADDHPIALAVARVAAEVRRMRGEVA